MVSLEKTSWAPLLENIYRKLLFWLLRIFSFSFAIYKTQIEEGMIFLHGDPVGSLIWSTTEMQKLRKAQGVQTLELDLCVFGGNKSVPSKVPMRFVTNSSIIARDQKRCDRLRDHRGGGGGARQREYPE